MFQSVTFKANLTPANAECLVLPFFGEKGTNSGLDSRTKAFAAGLGLLDEVNAALARTEATGDAATLTETFVTAPKKRGQAAAAPQRVLLLGLGVKDKFDGTGLRNAAAAVGRRLAAVKGRSVWFELDGVLGDIDASQAGTAVGEGLGLLGWVCDEFRGKATPDPKRVPLAIGGDGDFGAGIQRGLGLAESTNYCRTLSQTPPNVATPEFLADQAQKLGRKHGLSVRIWEGDALEKDRFEGLINVGKASENLPRMIRLEWNPKGATGKPIVFIGKAMTYDTGGLSLKINNSMVGMKRDKDGGCAVLGAMHAIATVIKPRKRVVAFLASAENSISDEAYRPDDVITYRNGVTVEITNTDAEGRLVLADALCWACEKENPACIVDLATLTGGVITALGSTFCGMFCEDDKLRARIEEAAKASGERVWRLPMHQEYRDMMKSPVADILNSNPNRKAHPIQGAAFLSYFVDEKIPWCHLDIAGVHVAEKNAGPYIDGPTGWGVRLLANLVDQ
jgi:leucyl aminopeptidase